MQAPPWLHCEDSPLLFVEVGVHRLRGSADTMRYVGWQVVYSRASVLVIGNDNETRSAHVFGWSTIV